MGLIARWRAARQAREQTRARLGEKFFVADGVGLPWGETIDRLTPPFARIQTWNGQRWRAPCAAFLGVPTLFAELQDPPLPEFPVECVSYEITAAAGLRPRQVLDRLEAALGPPSERSHDYQHRPSADNVTDHWQWEWGLAGVSVSIYGATRDVDGEGSLGCIGHSTNETRKLAWATDVWRARGGEDRRWAIEEPGCEAHGFELERVENGDGPRDPARARDDEIRSTRSFDNGFLAATPAWIAERIPQPPDGTAVWFHPAAKKWGIATATRTTVFDDGYAPALSHDRVEKAKGPGGASVGAARGPSFVSAYGDPAALDTLVAFLAARLGCAVTVHDSYDC